jgi:hypothetical protein
MPVLVGNFSALNPGTPISSTPNRLPPSPLFAHRLRSPAPSSPGPQDEPGLVTMALQIEQFRAFFQSRIR